MFRLITQLLNDGDHEFRSQQNSFTLNIFPTRCLGQILYFLLYPSSGTAGIMPRPFPIRVHRHGPPRGSTWRPIPKARLRSYTRSPSGSDSMSPMGHPMEGPTARMDRLWVIRSMSQPSPYVSLLYDTLNPTGPSHPMNRVKSTHDLGHPVEWVAPWVRSAPTKTLDLLDLTM